MDYKSQNMLWIPTSDKSPRNDTTCLVTVKWSYREYELKKDLMDSENCWVTDIVIADYVDGKWEDFTYPYNNQMPWFCNEPTEVIDKRKPFDFSPLPLVEEIYSNNGHSYKAFYSGVREAVVIEYEVKAFVELPDCEYNEECHFCCKNGGENCDDCEFNIEESDG